MIGGAGYIGSVVTRRLIKKNFDVTCLDNLIYKNSYSLGEFKKNNKFNFVLGDLRNESLMNKLLSKCDAVIILAGLVGDPITKKYPKESKEINYLALKNFINKCNGKKIEKVIFISTCSNYGLIDGNNIADENYILKPLSDYAKYKIGRAHV